MTSEKYCINCKTTRNMTHIPDSVLYACDICCGKYDPTELEEAFLRANRVSLEESNAKIKHKQAIDLVELGKRQQEWQTYIVKENSGGLKFDSDKPRMELLDPYALEQIALVLAYGAKKYTKDGVGGEHNWRKGFKWSRLIGAAFRHLTAIMRGEFKDSESSLPHAAHLGCCAMFLIWHMQFKPELNDIPKEMK